MVRWVNYKGRKCCKCGTDNSPKWYKYYGKDDHWLGEWLCKKCWLKDYQKNNPYSSHNIQKYLVKISKAQKERLEIKRKCHECGTENTSHWYKDGKLDLCAACYQKLPNSPNSIRKSLAKCRTKRIIDINKFDELDDNDIGRIIEDIVCDTYGIKNYNDETDNYRSPFDAIHPEYGRLQIKGASLNVIDGEWQRGLRYTEILWREFDFMIFVCMDENKPWRNVERVYKIPQEEFSNRRCITIIKDPSRGTWYEKYRIEEGPFNSSWHDIKTKGYIIRGNSNII